MSNLLISYDFNFCLTVLKKNGKVYKKHLASGLGSSYEHALWYVYFALKKRRSKILEVSGVKANRIAFAFSGREPIKLNLEDYPAVIPQDLNKEVKRLPQQ